jgi:hypothetical protein
LLPSSNKTTKLLFDNTFKRLRYNYNIQGDNLMDNYKRKARLNHYKNKFNDLKKNLKEIGIRLNILQTPEVHIAAAMPNRQLPEEI